MSGVSEPRVFASFRSLYTFVHIHKYIWIWLERSLRDSWQIISSETKKHVRKKLSRFSFSGSKKSPSICFHNVYEAVKTRSDFYSRVWPYPGHFYLQTENLEKSSQTIQETFALLRIFPPLRHTKIFNANKTRNFTAMSDHIRAISTCRPKKWKIVAKDSGNLCLAWNFSIYLWPENLQRQLGEKFDSPVWPQRGHFYLQTKKIENRRKWLENVAPASDFSIFLWRENFTVMSDHIEALSTAEFMKLIITFYGSTNRS